MKSWIAVAATGAALALAAGTASAADLPKKGTISGKFGWYGIGKVSEVGKGHFVFVGEFNGPFIADSGGGFAHGATVNCFGINDVRLDGAESSAQGYCIVIDADGDKAYSKWSNKGGPASRPGGDNTWIGGTGKYAGLKGTNKFDTTVSPHGAGVSVWHSGSYELQ